VFSSAPQELIGALLTKGGLSPDAWSCQSIPHSRIPEELAVSHAGLFFLTQGLSEHGCSPTKFGEYWATGLPVVTTPNVSDSEEIILRERVGVVVREHSDAAYERAADELLRLLADPEMPQRCRRTAEVHYSLERACQEQLALYKALVTRSA
jgi:glycosyltransferase involved in cell wall biosynthesis